MEAKETGGGKRRGGMKGQRRREGHGEGREGRRGVGEKVVKYFLTNKVVLYIVIIKGRI